MTLTPRQIAAYLELGRIDRANDLMIAAIGAQGDSETIERALKEINGS
jgi:hypothetical protein